MLVFVFVLGAPFLVVKRESNRKPAIDIRDSPITVQ